MSHDHSRNSDLDHHRMMIRDFRTRFYVTLVLTLPVLALSELIQSLVGVQFSFPGAPYVVLALATTIFVYGGKPFLAGLWEELRRKEPGMMTLIGLAITVAYVYSAAVTFGLEGTPFYWELATLIAIMLAGHWIEMASVVGASSALEKLAELMPSTAHRKTDSGIEDAALSDIRNGNIVVIKPGEKIPSDGLIAAGSSFVDESMLTGESRPVRKKEGARLIGGSVNGSGSVELRVEGSGEDSYLAKVITLVQEAQATKSRTQALSDRAAFWLTMVAITVGATTLVVWLLLGKDVQFSIARMATGYNLVAIPLAAGVLYGVGAALMSLSTVVVAINARLLRVPNAV